MEIKKKIGIAKYAINNRKVANKKNEDSRKEANCQGLDLVGVVV